jgi:hypothetical protein
MRQQTLRPWVVLLCSLCLGIGVVCAHITPPVILLSERDAILGMMGNASRFFVREVKLTPEEREALRHRWGWYPDEARYRFYLGRDTAGQLVAAVTFLTEFTLHGPVRVAVGLDPDGKVKDAKVMELTEETFPGLNHCSTRTLRRIISEEIVRRILPWANALRGSTWRACPISTGRSSPA